MAKEKDGILQNCHKMNKEECAINRRVFKYLTTIEGISSLKESSLIIASIANFL
jgi:hypothetical protein